MKNLVANLKDWICEICADEFQATEPYRAVNGERACKSCQIASYVELDTKEAN